ncbi:MAG: amino acid--tRNA ligase-related protein [bacterium]|nr:amino acid--tRNA ligase-related protein [bacterium]
MNPFEASEYIDRIPVQEWDFAEAQLTEFFRREGFYKGYYDHNLYNLSACEVPESIMAFWILGKVWALHQTNQMHLEWELLTNPNVRRGVFCTTTSYRREARPKKGRHNLIFPMFEFEMHGDINDLRALEERLLEFVGFGSKENYIHVRYLDMAERYNTQELTDEHERMMGKEFGPVVFSEYFPEYSNPFWNMWRDMDVSRKIDVLVYGVETVGSAQRSCNVGEMRDRFLNISNGEYAARMFAEFSEEAVMKELNAFLKMVEKNPLVRSGGGIGMTRWIRALKLAGIMPNFSEIMK